MTLRSGIFIVAGEPSGDLHGKNLVKSLLKQDPALQIRAYGGPEMEGAGAKIVKDYREFVYMGFYEVATHLRKILRNLEETAQLIKKENPGAVVFIDFPGFNLRLAAKLRKHLPQTRFYYYIAPQVWAWKTKRIHRLMTLMDKVFVILPFEASFYQQFGYKVEFVGHPLLDEISKIPVSAKRKDRLIAVLPGSRKQEISKILPVIMKLAPKMKEYHFEVSVVPSIPISFYRKWLKSPSRLLNVSFSKSSTYDLLRKASLAVVTSGTATLETAFMETPQVVVYKTSFFSYFVAKIMVKLQYISLVNLILNKEAVTELIQSNCTPEKLKKALLSLENPEHLEQLKADYRTLSTALGGSGASDRVACLILQKT